MHILIKSELEREITELKSLIERYADNANIHEQNANELPEVRDISIFWRNHYQQKECYCRQRLFSKEIELRKLVANT